MPLKRALAWTWTLVILALCWLPRMYMGVEERGPRPFFIPNLDKLVHLTIFAGFAYLWGRVESPRFGAGRILLAGVALAVVSELGQALPIVNRDATVGDGLADTAGVIVGLAARAMARRRSANRTPS